MTDGLNQYEGIRTPPVFWPMIRFMQAAAHVDAGTPEPGFELIDEALNLGGPDTVLAPQFHIVRGDLSLLGPAADAAVASASYERAFAVAAGVGARMPQLRAAVRLVRMAPDGERAGRIEGYEPSTRPSRRASRRPTCSRRPSCSAEGAQRNVGLRTAHDGGGRSCATEGRP